MPPKVTIFSGFLEEKVKDGLSDPFGKCSSCRYEHCEKIFKNRPVGRGGAMGAPAPPRRLLRSTFLLKKINSKKKIIVLFCLFCSRVLFYKFTDCVVKIK